MFFHYKTYEHPAHQEIALKEHILIYLLLFLIELYLLADFVYCH